MSRPKSADDDLSKFRLHRREQRHRGMKRLCIWVPDPSRPEFAREARRQGLLLRGRPEEAEALDFVAAATGWPEVVDAGLRRHDEAKTARDAAE